MSRPVIAVVAAVLLVAAVVVLPGQCVRIEQGIYDAGLAAERLRAGVDECRVDTGEEVIACLTRSGEGPSLVLLHGFASQKEIWLQMIHDLPHEWPLLVPDLPGHGDSSAELERDYSATSMARAIIRFIEQQASEQPVHLAGNSLGGATALLVAAERPDLVASLTLFNPAGAPGAVVDELTRAGASADNALIVTSRADFERMVELVFHDPPLMPWPLARVLTRMHVERAELHGKIWTDLARFDDASEDLFDAIRMPVLLVWGEDDRVLDRSSVDYFTEHLADIEVQWLEAVGHAPMIERPQHAASLLAEFIERRHGARD